MSALLTALLGVSAAIVYGGADFLGGIASKRISAILVTAVGAVTGLVGLLIAFPIFGGTWSTSAVLLGSLTGVTGAVAISLLYACLARGPMSILSPITAVVSAVVPLVWAVGLGERLQPIGYVGLAVALVAVILIAIIPEKSAVRATPTTILMAVASGALIGVFLIAVNAAPDDSGLIPLIFNRVVNSALMFSAVGVVAFVAARRKKNMPQSDAPTAPELAAARSNLLTGVLIAICCGFFDTLANVLILVGVRVGDLTVTSVLVAMYPAGTIILAAIFLRERIAPLQVAGLVLALAAAGMLAIA